MAAVLTLQWVCEARSPFLSPLCYQQFGPSWQSLDGCCIQTSNPEMTRKQQNWISIQGQILDWNSGLASACNSELCWHRGGVLAWLLCSLTPILGLSLCCRNQLWLCVQYDTNRLIDFDLNHLYAAGLWPYMFSTSFRLKWIHAILNSYEGFRNHIENLMYEMKFLLLCFPRLYLVWWMKIYALNKMEA